MCIYLFAYVCMHVYYMHIIYSFFLVLFVFFCWIVGIVVINPELSYCMHMICFCKLLLVQDSSLYCIAECHDDI